jgi:hypothetical protein
MPRTKKAVAPTSPFYARHGLRPDTGWPDDAVRDVEAMPGPERDAWHALFDHFAAARPQPPAADWKAAQQAAEWACLYEDASYVVEQRPLAPGSDAYHAALGRAGPDDAWLRELDRRVARLGGAAASSAAAASGRLAGWIRAAARSSVGRLNRPGPNRDLLRSALWSVVRVPTDECVDALRQLGTFATHHNTAQGVVVALVLARVGSEAALAALHLLAQASKRPLPRARFLRAADHVERRLGITSDQAAERFVPTFELDARGVRRADFGGCSAQLSLDGAHVVVRWTDAKGKVVKAPPAAARKTHAAEITTVKTAAKSIGSMLQAQRDRLDRLMAVPRTWPVAQFRRYYLDHPLVGHLARRLVWVLDGTPVLFESGQPGDVHGKPVAARDDARVGVWHPVGRPVEEVRAWRDRLAALQVTQPFKQAHREVYPLTDAERTTRTYSNRFAGHVLRQHQFGQLARARGWEFSLLGMWDGGSRAEAKRAVPGTDLRAEFWVTVTGNEETTDAGIVLYVSTDQVRFYRGDGRQPAPLDEVPPLALSETLRDVDLFVGVASVGNDPTWRDGGPGARYHDYWNAYSFGELAETAKTRRAALESLLPRLTRLRDKWKLTDRFLVVRGSLRTYKIHLGSGNILMEPNDQYLCIVPNRSADATADVFLPFEGDGTLAVVLSKAFLLADDARIKDETITRQIARA